MKKTLLPLLAATVIAAGTIANPTPSRAMAPLLVGVIIVAAVIGTVVVVQAVSRPSYASTGNVYVRPHKKKKMM